jgi:hypothetical protein
VPVASDHRLLALVSADRSKRASGRPIGSQPPSSSGRGSLVLGDSETLAPGRHHRRMASVVPKRTTRPFWFWWPKYRMENCGQIQIGIGTDSTPQSYGSRNLGPVGRRNRLQEVCLGGLIFDPTSSTNSPICLSGRVKISPATSDLQQVCESDLQEWSRQRLQAREKPSY